MRRSRFATLLLVSALLMCKSGANQPPNEMRLSGVWKIVSVEREGSTEPTHIGATLTFVGDRVTFQKRLGDGNPAHVAPIAMGVATHRRRVPS